MRRYILALAVLLTPASGALSEEIYGIGSRAVDISPAFTLGGPFSQAVPGRYGAAFTTFAADGRPTGITIQSRSTSPNRVVCSTTLSLPEGARRASHPALSSSGWLFVSVEGPDGWRLVAWRRAIGLQALNDGSHCQGWDTWPRIDLGAPERAPERAIASAPDAVSVGPLRYTYVFVTRADGRISYLVLTDMLSRRPVGWSDWETLAASQVSSKPAAVYEQAGHHSGIHLFWLDPDRSNVRHRRMNIFDFVNQYQVTGEGPTEQRAMGDGLGPATASTGCSAGPEVISSGPLFVVCGNDRRGGVTSYSIASYRDLARRWDDDAALEMVGRQPWISRDLPGAISAPSLGPTGLAGEPLMFVAFGTEWCSRYRLLGVPCITGQFLIQDHHVGTIYALRSWERPDPDGQRWGDLN